MLVKILKIDEKNHKIEIHNKSINLTKFEKDLANIIDEVLTDSFGLLEMK